MPAYRVFYLSPNGCFQGREDIGCASDEEAIAVARATPYDGRKELWNGPCLIATFAADGTFSGIRPRH